MRFRHREKLLEGGHWDLPGVFPSVYFDRPHQTLEGELDQAVRVARHPGGIDQGRKPRVGQTFAVCLWQVTQWASRLKTSAPFTNKAASFFDRCLGGFTFVLSFSTGAGAFSRTPLAYW